MKQIPQMSMEERIEERLFELELATSKLSRDVAVLLQSLRILAEALSVRDRIDSLIESLQRPSVPGE